MTSNADWEEAVVAREREDAARTTRARMRWLYRMEVSVTLVAVEQRAKYTFAHTDRSVLALQRTGGSPP